MGTVELQNLALDQPRYRTPSERLPKVIESKTQKSAYPGSEEGEE